MLTRSRTLAPTLLAAATAVAVAMAPAQLAGSTAPPAGDSVEFETLGVVSSTAGINLGDGHVLRVVPMLDVESTRDLLAAGTDGSFADEVADLIAELGEHAGRDDNNADRVVLVGVIDTSCTAATDAGLVRDDDGNLSMYAPGHVPEDIECFVPVVTVAVLAVDAADAPPGSTDRAELVAFEMAGYAPGGGGVTAVELTDDDAALTTIVAGETDLPDLPPLPDGHRRFAFVLPGCQQTTAELIVTPRLIDARLAYDDPSTQVMCVRAEYFLAVFDVPDEVIPPAAELVG